MQPAHSRLEESGCVIYSIHDTYIKGGCAHFDMCNFYSKLIDLDPQDTFFTILPQADFLFSLLGQKQVCDTGDEAVMKIHKKINIGIPEKGTFSAITSKV